MSLAIKVENISKKYTISHQQTGIGLATFRDEISGAIKKFSRKIRDEFINQHANETFAKKEEFWALKDITFEVQQGDRVGIIGRNGAGKSTLLKIMSRITEPTLGKFKIKGRIASLLEVGTGFHQELTGRENIYLNGAILGMSKVEIKKKFDEIVAFAEVEKFLDTPVKRYSSGMYVRLAFAIAAHLDPDILIIDEVLSVGDAAFQKKCLGTMKEVADAGRTILFVSHNLNLIKEFCGRALLLDRGCLESDSANVDDIIQSYLFSTGEVKRSVIWVNNSQQYQNMWFEPNRFFIGNEFGDFVDDFCENRDDFWIYIEGVVKQKDPGLQIGYALYNENGILLYWSCQTDGKESECPQLHKGLIQLKSKIPPHLLNEGMYRFEMIVALYYRQWLCQPGKDSPAVFLNIRGGLSESSYWREKRPGLLAPVLKWEIGK
jgi:lipopolysaccharide transport system ATP-binding protein